jgi:hypothetical protein
MLDRFAFWPLAYVGARALHVGDPKMVAFVIILASLVASSLMRAGSPRRTAAGVFLSMASVAAASFPTAGAAVQAIGSPLAALPGLALALTATISYARMLMTARAFAEPALDTDALALVPAATWLASCALLTRLGAEAAHVHASWLHATALIVGAFACLLAALAAATLAKQRTWLERIYDGTSPLTIAASLEPARLLSHVVDADADVVVVPRKREPYREHGVAIARVPFRADLLTARYGRRARNAALALASAVVFVAAGAGSPAAHGRDAPTIPERLPPLPGLCAREPPTLVLLPLAPLRTLDLDEVAARYRGLGVAVRVEPAIPIEPGMLEAARNQLVAEEVLRAVAQTRAQPGPRELVIAVTDHDMYPRSGGYRFAFAQRQGDFGVLSVARMDPSFPLFAPREYVPKRASCTLELRARAYKMITRALVTTGCGASHTLDGRSVRRMSLMSLGDLDEIEESRF